MGVREMETWQHDLVQFSRLIAEAEAVGLWELTDQAVDLYPGDDIEIDGKLYPCDISEADNGVWVRGWIWIPQDSEDDEDDRDEDD